MENSRYEAKRSLQVTWSKRTLQEKYWESDLYCTIKFKGKTVFSNEFWPRVFASTDNDLDLVGVKGQWAREPQLTLYFLPQVKVEFDEIEVKLSRNGKVWYQKKSGPMTTIFMEPQDTFQLIIPLRKIWNGK